MSNMLWTYREKIYKYTGDVDVQEKGLTIGGYKSAWLADLVAAFLLQKLHPEFLNKTKFAGIYRDDGIIVFPKQLAFEVSEWLEDLQQATNEICNNTHFQRTGVFWGPSPVPDPTNDDTISPRLSFHSKNWFPYLDMRLWWTCIDNDMGFTVHMKENQQLLYLPTAIP